MERLASFEAGSTISPKINLTSQRNVDICSDTITKSSEIQDLNTADVADLKLVNQDSVLKSEQLIASDHVTEDKKKTTDDYPQVFKTIPEKSLASSILEVCDVVGMDDSDIHQDLKSVPVISKEEIKVDLQEPLQSAHQTSEVKEVQRTEHLKKQVRISEKASVDSEEGSLDAIREQIVETTDVLKPLVKPQPLKENASGMLIVKTSALTVEEINQSEKEDLNRTLTKLIPQENINRKQSAQNAIVISDPVKTVDKLEPIETILTDNTKFAAKRFQSKENIVQEQLIPHVQESTSSAMKIFDAASQGQLSLESNLHILHNKKDELTENEIPFHPTNSMITIHADVIDDSKDIKNPVLNKETIVVDSAGQVTMLDGRDHSQSSSRASRSKDLASNVPRVGQETTPLETTEKINPDTKRERSRTRLHEGNEFETRLEVEEIVEHKPVQELPNVTQPTFGQPKLSHSGPDNVPLVLSENISLGLIDNKDLKEVYPNANQISIENESRIEEIIQEIETVPDDKKNSNQEEDIFVKAVPSRDTSISRDDSRILELHEVQPLPIKTKKERRGARRSRDHSSHGINETVVQAEVTSPLPKVPSHPSRISRSRNSSIPRMSQETTPLETTTSSTSSKQSFKREHSQSRIHDGDDHLINKAKKSTSMYGLAMAKQSHSDKISEFEAKDRSPTTTNDSQLEESANVFVENNIPHKVNKIEKVEAPTAVVSSSSSEAAGIFASLKLKHHDYLLAGQHESVQGTAKSLSPIPDLKNSYQSLYLGPSNTLDLEVTDNVGTTAEMKQNFTQDSATLVVDPMDTVCEKQTWTPMEGSQRFEKDVFPHMSSTFDIQPEQKRLASKYLTLQLEHPVDVDETQKTEVGTLHIYPQSATVEQNINQYDTNKSLLTNQQQAETAQSETILPTETNKVILQLEHTAIDSSSHSQQEGLAAATAISSIPGRHTVSEGILTSQVQHSEESKPGNINKRERKTRSASRTRSTRDVSASRIGQETTPFETTTKIHQTIKREHSQPRFHDTDELKILPTVGGIDVHGFPKRLDDQPKQIQTLINVSPNLVVEEENTKHEGTIINIDAISQSAPAVGIEPVQAILEGTINTSTNNANRLPTSRPIFKQPELNICENESQMTPLNKMEEVFEVTNNTSIVGANDLTSNSEKANVDIIEAIVLHEVVTETPESHAPAAIIPVKEEEFTRLSPKKNVRFLDVAKLSEETFLEDAAAVIKDPLHGAAGGENFEIVQTSYEAFEKDQVHPQEIATTLKSKNTIDDQLKSSSMSIAQPLSDVIEASVMPHSGVLPLDSASLISEQKVATGNVDVAQESHISKTTESTTAFEEHDILKMSTLQKSIATSNVAFNQESAIEDNNSQIQGELSKKQQNVTLSQSKAKVKRQELLSDESSISSQPILSEAVKEISKADNTIPSTEKARTSQPSGNDSISHQNTLVIGSSKEQVIIVYDRWHWIFFYRKLHGFKKKLYIIIFSFL